MKFEVTISKRALVIAGFFFVIMGSFFVYAVTPNPGHDANMVGDGNGNEPFGGKSTFAGTAASWYAFPGHLGIGPQSIHRAYAAELFINSTDAWSGIGISSTGSINGDTYIDFMKDGTIGANINYRNGRLEFNAHPGAVNTDAILVTPAYFTVRGRDVTSAAAPGIRFSEIGSSNEWHIIKRGSQYATVAERDALLFSHWDGAQWASKLFMNRSDVCINGDCNTFKVKTNGQVCVGSTCQTSFEPQGTWCGWDGSELGAGVVNCKGLAPRSGCPTSFLRVQIPVGSLHVYACVKQ